MEQSERFTVETLPVPRFESCTYIVRRTDVGEALVIDPGDRDVAPLMTRVSTGQVSVPFIVLTHEHIDHAAGANAARESFGSRMICSRTCAESILDPKRNLSRYFIQQDVSIGPADWICEDHDWKLDWAGLAVRFIATPGHSPGGMCIGMGNSLFTGDTLLGNVKTPTNLPGGSKDQLGQSVGRLLKEFGPETRVYPGHGQAFHLGQISLSTVVGNKRTQSQA